VCSAQAAEGETTLEINIQDLPQGAYFVRWASEGQPAVTKKLVVRRAD
jgi:hypothetical protein